MRESVPGKVTQSIAQSTGYKWQLLCAKEGKWGWIDVDVWAAEPEGQQRDGACRPGLVLPRDMCLCKSRRDQQHRRSLEAGPDLREAEDSARQLELVGDSLPWHACLQ